MPLDFATIASAASIMSLIIQVFDRDKGGQNSLVPLRQVVEVLMACKERHTALHECLREFSDAMCVLRDPPDRFESNHNLFNRRARWKRAHETLRKACVPVLKNPDEDLPVTEYEVVNRFFDQVKTAAMMGMEFKDIKVDFDEVFPGNTREGYSVSRTISVTIGGRRESMPYNNFVEEYSKFVVERCPPYLEAIDASIHCAPELLREVIKAVEQS